MDKLALIIPAYNEEKRIGNTLKEYSNYFNDLFKKGIIDYELLVVINNTKDNTLEIVKKYQKKNKKINYLNLIPGGKGYAVIEGFKHFLNKSNNFIGFVDADMATSPEEFFKLVKNVGNYGGAIASRYVKNSVIKPKPTMQRLMAKRLFNMISRALLQIPYRDTQCGAKIFRKEVLAIILPKLSMSQWAFDVEMLYWLRKKGFKVREVPTVWEDKEYSKINFWSAGPMMALGIIRLRIINTPFKRIIRIYDLVVK